MLISYLSHMSYIWVLPLLAQVVSYVMILKKMGKRPWLGIIPVLGEMEMSKDLFRYMRSFWRPAVITAAMFLTSWYIGGDNEYSVIMKLVAFIVYGVFLIRLYWRLAKQFGKGKLFALGMILIPVLFLPVLAFGKSAYRGKRAFKPEKERSNVSKRIRKTGLVAVSAVELAVLVLGCFFITVLVHPVRPLTEYMLKETMQQLSSVKDSDEIVGREDTLGADYMAAVEAQRTREYFFPDHSADRKVVVMEYVIGADLEDARGSASINIAQMKDATAKGDGLDFVMQAGGSKRWFTSGMEDGSVARYLISGGKLETVEDLDGTMCLSEPKNLTDFIVWTKENYPADRYMLVLWDHGGGFASGYGMDDLNKRTGETKLMTASEIIGAIKDAGVKFDLIGFDACLMQNAEYANALEPFADFYLASEETEPGTGWFYTAGFGRLAADPTMSTEEFAKSMISSYDQCNRAMHKGEPQPEDTLSLVDLTLVKPVYAQLEDLYDKASGEIADKPVIFGTMSAARSGSYEFADSEQVDMISLLANLRNADYKQQLIADEELDKIADSVKACVVYRNSDSAEGVNGLAVDFPYTNINMYNNEYKQLKAVKYKSEQNFFNNFCSIMASQQLSQYDKDSFFGMVMTESFVNQDWYIKGFEDYDTTDLFIDIPVIYTENGYLPELPEKTWDTILDCKTAAYLVTAEGLMYIGSEHFEVEDESGHPLVSMNDIWANVNGHLVCYETETPMATENGIIYRGTARARLNGTEDITLHIEWEPVAEDSDAEITGHVTGYSKDKDGDLFFLSKGLEQFKTGDTIEFLFDFYDEEGKLINSETYGNKLHVISNDRLTVKDEPFESGTEIQYFGVLTDIYQRELMTEEIREMVE